MLIDRIYLRNYRVFEEELELDLPPGLVGVYGPNGAGKSSLLESILWTLWGKARTAKEEIPSASAHGECIAEVTFEHEGHIYVVRRTINGVNATVKAGAQCDGLAMAEGVRDTGRYVHSVLGMDDAAFRASVFAEQKQLAAFSSQSPADRRKLVLALLGVTPLDAARDKARADAREAMQQHTRLRAMLPDREEARLAAADSEARAGAAEVTAAEEEGAAGAAQAVALASKESFAKADVVRQEHEILVLQGKAARAELEMAKKDEATHSGELVDLAETEARLADLEPRAGRVAAVETQARLTRVVADTAAELAAFPDDPPPPAPADEALAAAEEATLAARTALGSAEARRQSASLELQRANEALNKSASLSQQEDCPLCGQALGEAFANVQAHRSGEVYTAEQRLASAQTVLDEASTAARTALESLQRVSGEVSVARQARAAWDQAQDRRAGAGRRLASSLDALAQIDPATAQALKPSPAPETARTACRRAEEELAMCRDAQEEANRLKGRLDRRPRAELALRGAQERASTASSLLDTLRAKVKGLAFDPAALAAAERSLREAEAAAAQADSAGRRARLAAATARAQAEAEAKRSFEAEAQHSRLGELESSSVHLGRTAELLNGFRNSVVASVGPRLAVQAAELFAELTDNEYDRLEVDTDTYGLQICDSGISYDLERFSGSEVDLANLALRVAISEHVRFQAGGSVGLLVLDEIFGPLDEERRTRMLLALERLRGRFRQILVVTHSMEIKEQMPNAIEVVKRPGRRATARVMSLDG